MSSPIASNTSALFHAHSPSIILNDGGLRQEAAPHHLGTVKFPIDHLDPHWHGGRNRPINETHCRNLRERFKVGLDRTNPAHWLRVACHKQDVELMKTHLVAHGRSSHETGVWLDFMDWGEVVQRPAVLWAGQHRVQALQQLLEKQTEDSSSAGDRWWICDLYDQATCPPALQVRLRANREDVLLPDSHGQVWNELSTLAQQQPELFRGKAKEVEQRIGQALDLTEHNKFPVGRLGTLWRNDRWRTIISELCAFAIGQNLFNISTFESFSSRRLDDLWFVPLRQLTRILHVVRDRCDIDLALSDWTKLVDLCPQDVVSSSHLSEAFFPSDPAQQRGNAGGKDQPRRKGFLVRLNDDQYHRIYIAMSGIDQLQFTDIVGWLKMSKNEGKLISTVMAHIVRWLNLQPYEVRDRSSSKPALRLDFVPALQHKHGGQADAESIVLQRDVAVVVRKDMSALVDPDVWHWMDEYPHEHPETYCTRFQNATWLKVLKIVYEKVGPHFQSPAMQIYNEQAPSQQSHVDADTLCLTVSRALTNLPTLQQHPILSKTDALNDLQRRLKHTIVHWVQDYHSVVTMDHSLKTVEPDTSGVSRITVGRSESETTGIQQPDHALVSADAPTSPSAPSGGSLMCSAVPQATPAGVDSPPASSSPGFEDMPPGGSKQVSQRSVPGREQVSAQEELPLPPFASTVSTRPNDGFINATTSSFSSSRTSHEVQTKPWEPIKAKPNSNTAQKDPSCDSSSLPTPLVPVKRKALSSGTRTWRMTPGVARRS